MLTSVLRLHKCARYSRASAPAGDLPPAGSTPTSLQPPIPSGGRTAASPSPRRTPGQYRNVDRSPVGIAFRLSLRSRLTLIRLALIRKPWPCGEGVSRPLCRYSYLHLPGAPERVAPRLQRPGNAPLPMLPASHGFGNTLHARLLSMPDRSTSELLRTL